VAEPHVVSALKAKRAELASEVQATEKRVDQLRADLLHVDAVLRLFDSATEPSGIPAKRPYRRRNWFSDGELPRRILDTLRTSPKPLSASAITASVMSAKGLDTGDAATLLLIRKGVQSYLRRQSGALVEPTGRKGRDGLWRVSGDGEPQERGGHEACSRPPQSGRK